MLATNMPIKCHTDVIYKITQYASIRELRQYIYMHSMASFMWPGTRYTENNDADDNTARLLKLSWPLAKSAKNQLKDL